MSDSSLPERASLEYLKTLAQERLRELRRRHPQARLSDAQLDLAREYGFASWRVLKLEVERRRLPGIDGFFAAAAAGHAATLRELLRGDPTLVRVRHHGTTALHLAVAHPEAVTLLLEAGADPNVRDTGDNALPLHFAAGGGHLESARALLDHGSDVHGTGDVHRLDVIGWATVFEHPHREVVDLLIARGARHHVFSAIALGDVDLLRRVVAEDPRALARRLSRFEQEQSGLHYVIAPPDGLVGGRFRTGDHHRTLAALIELGADLEARDTRGRTPLAVAMLRGDAEAMRLLAAAGARPIENGGHDGATLAELARSIHELTPMVAVPDLEATVGWYRWIGFDLAGSHVANGVMDWASVRFGRAELMLVPAREAGPAPGNGFTFWIRTERLDDLYAALKERQLERARATLAGRSTEIPEIRFTIDLHTAFHGQREFGIRDPNGIELRFTQPVA
jgi:ankyrin repeat protein